MLTSANHAHNWRRKGQSTIVILVLILLCDEGLATWNFWKNNPWGPDDEIGATNYITSASVLRAIQTVRTGKTYSLGMVMDKDTPSFTPRTLSLTMFQPGFVGRAAIRGWGRNRLIYNDEVLHVWSGTGTQIDGIGHIGIGEMYYNGNNVSDFVTTTGATKLGLEKLPPVVGRAVVLDMAAYYGVDVVPEGTAYTNVDIVNAMKRQGVTIGEGDIVLFYSGWMKVLDEQKDPNKFISVEPGIGVSGAWELVNRKVVAVGADTWGVEAVPSENEEDVFRVHQILITRHGIPLLENINTTALVKEGVYEFMFVLGVTKIRGAVQMMINPVGIA